MQSNSSSPISPNEDQSFSMAFNPITNIKTIREYEEEIKTLKEEIFGLKAQMTHRDSDKNLPKILYENNVKVEETLRENKLLVNTISSLKNQLMDLNSEKQVLLSRIDQSQFVHNEKLSLLQDENKRLLHKMSKTIKTEEQLRNIIVGLENEIKNIQTEGNLSFQNEVGKYQNLVENLKQENQQLKENCNNFTVKTSNLEQEIHNLRQENNNLKNEIPSFQQKIADSSVLRQEVHELRRENLNLKNGIANASMVEKNQVENLNSKLNEAEISIKNLQGRNFDLKNKNDELNFKLSDAINDYSQLESKCQKIEAEDKKALECFSLGLDRFRELTFERIVGLSEKLMHLKEQSEAAAKHGTLSPENKEFLEKALAGTPEFVKKQNFMNSGISALKLSLQKLRKEQRSAENKNAVLENENKDITKFNRDNKSLGNLQERITEAMTELNLCRNYMEKKARENKELKNENSRLRADQKKTTKQLENAKKFYENVVAKYGSNCIRI